MSDTESSFKDMPEYKSCKEDMTSHPGDEAYAMIHIQACLEEACSNRMEARGVCSIARGVTRIIHDGNCVSGSVIT